jgi:hypothetical protein
MVRHVKTLLRRSLFGTPQREWTELVAWVTSSINSTVSRAIGYSPHEVFFGEPPRPLIPDALGMPVSIHLGDESAAVVDQYVCRIRQQVARVQARARDI